MKAPMRRPAIKVETVETPRDERESISIRKIDNGYIIRHESTGPKGEWRSREMYSEKKPYLGIPKGKRS